MPNRYDKLIAKLAKKPQDKEEFIKELCFLGGLFSEPQTELELALARGLPLVLENDKVFWRPSISKISEEKFCFVDIETNGNSPYNSQPTEIGAIMVQNGKIISKFHSLIFCEFIPEKIISLTGIHPLMLKNAPNLAKVLADFRIFLGDAIFVAHNVSFDYHFLSHCLFKNGFDFLYNPRLCTIALARRSITSPKYSLQFLNEFLGINTPISHRANADAMTAWEVFKIALRNINAKSAQELINFSQTAQPLTWSGEIEI